MSAPDDSDAAGASRSESESESKPGPRVTFGIIVLNGEPFVRYCLRALYPFAHEIIVVEGACEAARNSATADAHSRDGTLETLRRFREEEDPRGKLTIITRDGFWPEKDVMSRAYAERASGDYLWQVDIDEFYHPRDMGKVLALLGEDASISAVSFPQIQFWGGFDHYVDGWYLRRGGNDFHRLFRWGPGFRYACHRPPTVVDEHGRDTRGRTARSARDMASRGIFLHHYSLVFPEQVLAKCDYYLHAPWARRVHAMSWAEEVFLRLERPFRAHNVYQLPSWLERFAGEHPPEIRALRGDLARGRHDVTLRGQDDIERLLATWRYRLGRSALKTLEPVDRVARRLVRAVRRRRARRPR